VRRCVNWLQGDVSTRQSGSSTCRMQILCKRFCIQDGRIKKLFCIRQRPRSCEGVRTLSHSKLAALKACSPTDRPIECKIFWIRRTNILGTGQSTHHPRTCTCTCTCTLDGLLLRTHFVPQSAHACTLVFNSNSNSNI
jgi:hypothetical protein